VISTDKAPAAVGPYSQGVKVGDTVYVSGCIGLVPGACTPTSLNLQSGL
jgi:enamine deaminase RidA (YjgF/YER057c/UK114 family)